jgi:hypothetical protein
MILGLSFSFVFRRAFFIFDLYCCHIKLALLSVFMLHKIFDYNISKNLFSWGIFCIFNKSVLKPYSIFIFIFSKISGNYNVLFDGYKLK